MLNCLAIGTVVVVNGAAERQLTSMGVLIAIVRLLCSLNRLYRMSSRQTKWTQNECVYMFPETIDVDYFTVYGPYFTAAAATSSYSATVNKGCQCRSNDSWQLKWYVVYACTMCARGGVRACRVDVCLCARLSNRCDESEAVCEHVCYRQNHWTDRATRATAINSGKNSVFLCDRRDFSFTSMIVSGPTDARMEQMAPSST